MVTCSSTLAWRIPWTEEPGRLWSLGLQGAGHDLGDLAHMHALATGASQVVLVEKNLPADANAGDVRGTGLIPGSGIPGLGRSPSEGNSYACFS